MPVTIAAAIQSIMTVSELDTLAAPMDNTITYSPLSESVTYSADSTPPATKDVPFSPALVGGAVTLDLTALLHSNDSVVNGTGLKVRACKFRNPATNANDIVLTPGASNGYLLLGTGWKVTLKPGQSIGPLLLLDGAPVIGSGAKNIDVSGTGTQSVEGHLILG